MRSKQYDILILDDDPDDRLMMGEAFTAVDCGDRVTLYESSFSFQKDMEALRELSPLPLLIVLDYNLPGADGSVVLGTLQQDEVLRSIPVVMYSTGMSRSQQADCLVKGAIGCFEKGSTYTELISFCRQLCDIAFGNRKFV